MIFSGNVKPFSRNNLKRPRSSHIFQTTNPENKETEEMPKFNMTVPHSLAQDEAVKRVKHLLGDVRTQFADTIGELHEAWDGHTGRFDFSAMGYPITGSLTVNPSQVDISGELPFAAMLFKGKIESAIKDRLGALLA